MKHFLLVFIVFISVVLLSSCAQQKQLVEDPPFVIYKPYYFIQENTADSLYENINLYLPVRQIAGNVALSKVYFKNKEAKLNEQIGKLYKASIPQIKEEAKWKVVISSEMGDEMSNPLPDLKSEPPVKAESDEAVLVYTQGGEEWFYIFKPQFKRTR